MVNATPRPLYPHKRVPYQSYRKLCGLQGRSGRARKILPPPEFDPRTLQPVAVCEESKTDKGGNCSNCLTRSFRMSGALLMFLSPPVFLHAAEREW